MPIVGDDPATADLAWSDTGPGGLRINTIRLRFLKLVTRTYLWRCCKVRPVYDSERPVSRQPPQDARNDPFDGFRSEAETENQRDRRRRSSVDAFVAHRGMGECERENRDAKYLRHGCELTSEGMPRAERGVDGRVAKDQNVSKVLKQFSLCH